MNFLSNFKKIIFLLLVPLFLFSCTKDYDDEDFRNILFTAMQGEWLISTNSFEVGDLSIKNDKTIEFINTGMAYIREKETRKKANEEPVVTIKNEKEYSYQLDLENSTIYLTGFYKYQVRKITTKLMDVAVFEWTSEFGKAEQWNRISPIKK